MSAVERWCIEMKKTFTRIRINLLPTKRVSLLKALVCLFIFILVYLFVSVFALALIWPLQPVPYWVP